jgi:hypothetical protein
MAEVKERGHDDGGKVVDEPSMLEDRTTDSPPFRMGCDGSLCPSSFYSSSRLISATLFAIKSPQLLRLYIIDGLCPFCWPSLLPLDLRQLRTTTPVGRWQ